MTRTPARHFPVRFRDDRPRLPGGRCHRRRWRTVPARVRVSPLIFIAAGVVWLLVLAAAVALCRAAAKGDEMGELIRLDDYRGGWDWPERAA